jgi:site-specific DNA-methyltransferase (adenine-specific)
VIVNEDSRVYLKMMMAFGQTVDSIVTDPPYGLVSTVKRFGKEGSAPAKSEGATGVYARASKKFIGQEWDGTGIEKDPEFWRLCLHVLKPGGHLLAFTATKTTCDIGSAIKAGGFEIRDMLMWVYGTGMPRSHWQPNGTGSMLKPMVEPIIVARKPFAGTLKENVQAHGLGGFEIEGCRDPEGRWPGNVLIDGSSEVTSALPAGTSRLFYSPKATKKDRGQGNEHPAVKPTALMQWLVRLVTPPGGTVLDPFAGSGSTGKACRLEGFEHIGIEADPAFAAIAALRSGSDFQGSMRRLADAIDRFEEALSNAG